MRSGSDVELPCVDRHASHRVNRVGVENVDLLLGGYAPGGGDTVCRGPPHLENRFNVRALHHALGIDVGVEELAAVGLERAHRLDRGDRKHGLPAVHHDLAASTVYRGNDSLAAGGIAKREDLLAGYNAVSHAPVAVDELPYWEIYGAARWAVIALLQGQRFLTGGERSLELALTGLMPAEMELDALDAIAIFEAGGDAP